MGDKNKNIGKLFRKYGYSFPETSDEVRAFEEKFSGRYESPSQWPSIKDIIEKKDKKPSSLIIMKVKKTEASGNLAMAARDGKKISKAVREEMNKDKKNAKKK